MSHLLNGLVMPMAYKIVKIEEEAVPLSQGRNMTASLIPGALLLAGMLLIVALVWQVVKCRKRIKQLDMNVPCGWNILGLREQLHILEERHLEGIINEMREERWKKDVSLPE